MKYKLFTLSLCLGLFCPIAKSKITTIGEVRESMVYRVHDETLPVLMSQAKNDFEVFNFDERVLLFNLVTSSSPLKIVQHALWGASRYFRMPQ